MSSPKDEQKQPRPPTRDPRLVREGTVSPGVVSGRILGLAGLVLVVVGLLWWLIRKNIMVWPLVLLAVGVVAIVVYVITNRAEVASLWRQSTSRQALNSVIFALFVLGILVLVNFIGARHTWRHDFTKGHQYSLSQQTLKIVKGLKQPLQMIAFVSPDYYNADKLRARLREYSIASPEIKLQVIDPTTAIDKVKEYNVQFDGTIILKYGNKKTDVTGGSEQQLTGAILGLSQNKKTKIYFLAGDGEKNINGTGDDALAALKANLKNQQYDVEQLVLMSQAQPQVPADCAVLCIIGPQQPLPPKVLAAVKRYLQQGGNAFICLDIPPAPGLASLLKPYGVTPDDGVVFDPEYNFYGNIGVPLVVQPEDHEITKGLQGLFFPGCRSLTLAHTTPPPQYPGAPPPPSQDKAVPLLKTSDQAWLDTNFKPGTQPRREPGEKSGSLCLAAAVDMGKKSQPQQMPGMPPQPQTSGPGTRLVVVGDSDFLTDRVTTLGQMDLVFGLKSIAWLAKQQQLVSIPPKPKENLSMTLSSVQLKVTAILAFLLPFLVLLAGLTVWVLRRRG